MRSEILSPRECSRGYFFLDQSQQVSKRQCTGSGVRSEFGFINFHAKVS